MTGRRTAHKPEKRPLTPDEAAARFLAATGSDAAFTGDDEIVVQTELVEVAGTVMIGHGTLGDGTRVRFVGDHRMMATIAAAIAEKGPVPAVVGRWQVL